MSSASYNLLSRILHEIVLGNRPVMELAFAIEKLFYSDTTGNDQRHVFVSGLARSGSTILMRAIYATGLFSSLTYRDMPFVLCPNTWSTLTSRLQRRGRNAERVHADGIQIDYDSPEALEEVFWRLFGGDYIRQDRLIETDITTDSLENFRIFVELVNRRYGKFRYLSKNNNNILRLPALLKAFPCAVVLIPFRDPVSHAGSLLNQHRNFMNKQADDPFTRKYMRWLVHHEFGPDHRPFATGNLIQNGYTPRDIEYWLVQWINVYKFLLDRISADDRQQVFISHESLCNEGEKPWHALCHLIDIPPGSDALLPFRPASKPEYQTKAKELLEEANNLYEMMKTRSRVALFSR